MSDGARPGAVYAAVGSSVYRSTDYGESWTAAEQGLPAGARFFALALDPQDPSTIYAGGGVSRPGDTRAVIYKSIDGGKIWSPLNIRSPDAVDNSVNALAVTPGTPPVILAGVNVGLVLRTTDVGLTWSSMYLGSVRARTGLALDASDVNAVYGAGDRTEELRVYKSLDRGATWKVTDGRFERDAGPSITLIVDPNNPRVLFLATAFRVYKSTDGGESWRNIIGGLPRGLQVRSIALNPADANALYVGLTEMQCSGSCMAGSLYRSADAGETWTSPFRQRREMPVSTMLVDPTATNRLYMGTFAHGLYRSEDGGTSWSPASKGLPSGQTWQFAVEAGPPRIVYALTPNGLYKRAGDSVEWRADQGFGESLVTALAIDRRTSPPMLLAFTFDPESRSPAFYRSVDRGETWSRAGVGLPGGASPIGLAVDPVDPRIIYAGFGGTSDIDMRRSLYRSSDAGDKWTLLWSTDVFGGPHPAILAIDPSNHNVLYAGGGISGLHKSTDAGSTWQPMDLGLRESGGAGISDLAIDPRSPRTVYVSAFGVILKSIDAGENWSRSSTETGMGTGIPQPVLSIAINPRCSRIVYAGLAVGLYRSSDAARSWSLVGDDDLQGRTVKSIQLDPARPNEIYVAAEDGGIYLVPDEEAGRCP